MERVGILSPDSVEAARATYDQLVPAAKTVATETAKAVDLDGPFEEQVTGDVVATAHEALFASLLEVRVGDREAFDDWRAGYDGDVTALGSDAVPNVVWHAPPFGDRAVAATYADEREAAVATLRRQAFGRIYRDVLVER
jgi:hypothetical protein